MKSNVDEILDRLERWKDRNLQASGIVLSNNIKGAITDDGLVDTGRMRSDVGYVVRGDEVRAGSSIGNPPYPLFLNNGFRHHRSGKIVGPYRFMESGAAASEGELRAIWGREP